MNGFGLLTLVATRENDASDATTKNGGQVGELAFRVGDVISDGKRVDEHWYVGTLRGETGLVPSGYVEVGTGTVSASSGSEGGGGGGGGEGGAVGVDGDGDDVGRKVRDKTLSFSCEGYLWKKGGWRHNWRKRWFVLCGSGGDGEGYDLAYAEDGEGDVLAKAKGAINLDEATLEANPPAHHTHNWTFQISVPERTYYLYAETKEDKVMWIRALKAAIASSQA